MNIEKDNKKDELFTDWIFTYFRTVQGDTNQELPKIFFLTITSLKLKGIRFMDQKQKPTRQ